MFLEILIIDVQNIMLKIVEFILVVEMEKLMTEKLVEIVHRQFLYHHAKINLVVYTINCFLQIVF